MPDLSQEDKEFVKTVYSSTVDQKDNVQMYYNKRGATYDKVIAIIEYPGKCFEKMIEFLGTKDCLEEKRIIDIGCGTGRFGELLSKSTLTWKELHGLDISKGMIDVCSEKKIYDKLINAPLTPDPTDGISENQYDIAFSFGCFIHSLIPMQSINEMIRMVKPGGYIILTIYDPAYTNDYMAGLGEIIKTKQAELIKIESVMYKREWELDFQYVNAYLVFFKVLSS